MHELSLVAGIIKSVEAEKERHGFTKVNSIKIVCGKYNCLSMESLKFCFDISAKSTCMEGAQLEVSRADTEHGIRLDSLEVDK